jgi:hypothetical protein
MIDWTFALLFRPDIVQISMDREAAWLLRETASRGGVAEPLDQGAVRDGAGTARASTSVAG